MSTARPDAGPSGQDRPAEPRVIRERYELGEVLGSGGMADVHRATDRLLHRPVAVKVMRDLAGDESARARFTAEARTLAGLSHPGLVTVLDAGLEGLEGSVAEQPWLVMELVEGTTLADEIARGPLAVERVREVGLPLATALAYAHDRGVVHRDVKPANVLLAASGRVKLADFGIAKLMGDTAGHTRTGATVGSAAYLAPEQVRGEAVTGATDVWSLGLVLLEALTGTRAYPGPAMESAVARLHRAPEVPATLPEGWRSLLTAMLVGDPGARPSAAEVADRVRRLDEVVADAGTTRPLTGLLATRPATQPAAQASAPDAGRTADPGPAAAPRIDRAGDRIARAAVGLRSRLAATTESQRVLAGLAAVLVLLLVLAGVASGAAGSGTGDVPTDTPRRLQQPLQDLHDAVDGRTP